VNISSLSPGQHLRLQVDLASNGELNLVVADSNFGSPPTAQPDDESAWDRFQRSLSGNVRTYVNNLGDLRGKVEENVGTTIQPALTKTLQAANHFIFPGGQDFLFKNPQFGLALDLCLISPIKSRARKAVQLPPEHSTLRAANDVLQILIQGLPNVIDSPIDIPVISWLYHLVTGDDLTLLELSCLVVSIPVTITLKLLTGETPFPDSSFTSALKDAQSFEEIKRIFTGEVQARAELATGPEISMGVDLRKFFSAVLYSLAFWGSLPFAALTAAKAENPDPVVSTVHAIFYFVTTAPNLIASLVTSPKQAWWQVMAEVVYGLSAVQRIVDAVSTSKKWAFWDNISAGLDFTLGVVGMVPAIPAVISTKDAPPAIGQFFANVSWNANLIVSPAIKEGPEILGFKLFCIGLYGGLEGAMVLLVWL